MRILILAILGLFAAQSSFAQTQPPIEVYGELPNIRSMSISPDGQKIIYFAFQDGKEIAVVKSLVDGSTISAVDTTKVKANTASFITSDYPIITVSKTTSVYGFRGRWEYGATFAINLAKNEINQLLAREESLYPGQSGIGRYVGVSKDGKRAFMPAYTGPRSSDAPKYNLYTTSLENGLARVHANGRADTIDWFVNDEGVVLAREDWNKERKNYAIQTLRNGKWEVVYSDNDTEYVPFNLFGVKSDQSALIITKSYTDGDAMYELGFDGKISDEILSKDNKEIDYVITDRNRNIFGVQYSGMTASYSFFDPTVDEAVANLIKKYPGFNFILQSWSDDWSRIIFTVAGGSEAEDFYLFESQTGQLSKLATSRNIPADAVAEVQSIEYKARDDLTIPSLVTWPPGKVGQKSLPTLIMPHGGPASYDSIQFDWMAQYFSNRGYLVLQPNFRGSTGFGNEFADAGRGEWGKKMQDDVTDGVNALVKMGWSDPDRICIVGGSYGGYSALAGGAYTPELYKCVIALAPVTDLRDFINNVRYVRGRDSNAYDYWIRNIGDVREDKEDLDSTSPAKSAETFQAPVLLLHGKDDTVVGFNQSEQMYSALKKVGKDVEFVKLKGEDHWLSKPETRLETLIAMEAFLKKHNPANVASE